MSRFDEIKEQLDGLIQRVDIDAALKLADIAAELIQILKVIEDELGDTENDYAPDEPPIAVAELIERLREALK